MPEIVENSSDQKQVSPGLQDPRLSLLLSTPHKRQLSYVYSKAFIYFPSRRAFFSQKKNLSKQWIIQDGFYCEASIPKRFFCSISEYCSLRTSGLFLADTKRFSPIYASLQIKKMEQWKPRRVNCDRDRSWPRPPNPKGRQLPRPSHWYCERLMLTRLSSLNANHKSRSSSCCARKIRVSKLQSLSTAKCLCNRQIKFFGEFSPCRRRWFLPGRGREGR